jgi:hypothetical protein
MRAHISLPEDLVKEVDALTGPRKRSAFIEEAVRKQLVLARQRDALERVKNMAPIEVDPDDNFGWAGRDGAEWVHNQRQEDLAVEQRRIAEREELYKTAGQ